MLKIQHVIKLLKIFLGIIFLYIQQARLKCKRSNKIKRGRKKRGS